jgi:SAM-dependent methyltransferase
MMGAPSALVNGGEKKTATMHKPDIIEGYTSDAAALVAPFEAISCAEIFAPVADMLPGRPCRVLDVGAGTGRDAAWFADQGHMIVAAEPVGPFLQAARRLHPSPCISWVQDRLPELPLVRAIGERFDLITLIGVWQHLALEQRKVAIPTLAALAAPGGRLILSLRHGPGSPTRPCFPCDPDETIASAQACGLSLVRRRAADSVQQKNRDAGVTWTWLAFEQRQSRIQ